MNREEKIELIRKVYGDYAVKNSEDWDYRLPSEPLEDMPKQGAEMWTYTLDWNYMCDCKGKIELYRYPRIEPKPMEVVRDVPILWMYGEGKIGDSVRFGFAIGDNVTMSNWTWQIAGFMFDGEYLCKFPIEWKGEYIRASKARLVRWE